MEDKKPSQTDLLYNLLKDEQPHSTVEIMAKDKIQMKLPLIKRISLSRRGIKEVRNCKNCHNLFEVLLSDLKRPHNLGAYCSGRCSQVGRPRGVALTKNAWNKGLKLGDHPAIEKYAIQIRGKLNPMFGREGYRRGKKHTLKTRKLLSKIMSGRGYLKDKNPNWKGGISKENMLIRSSKEYRRWRLRVLERDGYICVICGEVPAQIHADHIKPFSRFPSLRFDINNGRTLCVSCHRETDTYGTKAIKYVSIANDNQPA